MQFYILLNLCVSWALLSLIWVIQLNHYPSFYFIDPNAFEAFQKHHTQSITYIVMPLMLAELALSVRLAFHMNNWIYYTALACVILIWAGTFFIQVPLHNKLMNGKDMEAIRQLVQGNWVRTVLWTIKTAILTYPLITNYTD